VADSGSKLVDSTDVCRLRLVRGQLWTAGHGTRPISRQALPASVLVAVTAASLIQSQV